MMIRSFAAFLLATAFITQAHAAGGIALIPSVATNADLLAASTVSYPTLVRRGFASDGDASSLTYVASNSACSLNAGNGDNGSQVKSKNGKCWLGYFPNGVREVEQFGAKGDDSADDTSAIQAAIVSANNGGVVKFAQGKTYKTTTTLQLGNGSDSVASTISNVALEGVSSVRGTGLLGYARSNGPTIHYTGTANPAIAIAGPLQGWKVSGLHINCTGTTSLSGTTGLTIRSGQFGYAGFLDIEGCEYGIDSTVRTGIPAGLTNVDSLHNTFEHISISLPSGVSPQFGIAIELPTALLGTTDYNTFRDIIISFGRNCTGGDANFGLYLTGSDGNLFEDIHFTGGNGTCTAPITHDYTTPGSPWPNDNTFIHIDTANIHGSGWANNGDPPDAASQQKLLSIIETNGATLPFGVAGITLPGNRRQHVATISIASPAVVTWNSHGLIAGSPVMFSTTGALPTGLAANTLYYVISAGLAANTFEVSTSPGGAAVNTSGTQSGTHVVTTGAPQ